MPSVRLSDTECQIARCQGEYPDIYDAHYDAIEQLKAANIVRARAATPRAFRSLGGLEETQ